MSRSSPSAGPLHRIVLTGFMGSGKTTVGRELAAQLGWQFCDLDEVVSAHAGLTVPEIFSNLGEPTFRRLEAERLVDLLTAERVVIALGGGAPESSSVQSALRAQEVGTAVVHLEGKFEAFLARCQAQAADPSAIARPLLSSPEETRMRFDRRKAAYAAIATYALDADEDFPAALAQKIARQLSVTS